MIAIRQLRSYAYEMTLIKWYSGPRSRNWLAPGPSMEKSRIVAPFLWSLRLCCSSTTFKTNTRNFLGSFLGHHFTPVPLRAVENKWGPQNTFLRSSLPRPRCQSVPRRPKGEALIVEYKGRIPRPRRNVFTFPRWCRGWWRVRRF